jgi:hypothetical protein
MHKRKHNQQKMYELKSLGFITRLVCCVLILKNNKGITL